MSPRSPGSRRPSTARARRGAAGEDLAEAHLRRAGLRILDRNWRSGHRELDLVAQEGQVVAFVEVKARGPGPQDPLEALGPAKRRDLRRAAGAWIRAHPGVGLEFRFDVVAVRLHPGAAAEVEHVRNAFYADDP